MRGAAFGLLALSLLACADQEEAKRVAAALDRMRDTHGAARLEQLAALEAMTIDGEVARAARDHCVPVYRAVAEANEQLDAAHAGLKDGSVQDAAERVAGAGEKLKQAQAGIASCNEKIAALKASIR